MNPVGTLKRKFNSYLFAATSTDSPSTDLLLCIIDLARCKRAINVTCLGGLSGAAGKSGAAVPTGTEVMLYNTTQAPSVPPSLGIRNYKNNSLHRHRITTEFQLVGVQR